MNDGPLVSIVVNFLNAERFIEEALESAFAQTYQRWELLLVDDGSTDGSTEIARRYAAENPDRLRYLEHPDHTNRGMSASRNLGIRSARGQYIAFLDADDVWLSRKLEQQVRILDSQPQAAMVYGLSEYWYSWSDDTHPNRDFLHELGVPSHTLIRPPTLITRFFLAQDAAVPSPTDILVRREVVERIGGFEESFRGPYEDQALYAKLCLVEPVFAVNACWDRVRQDFGSTDWVMAQGSEAYATRLVFLTWLARYLAEERVDDPDILRRLQKELWRCRHPTLSRLWSERRKVPREIVRRALARGLR